MRHDRPQQFAGNFTRPLLLAEPRHTTVEELAGKVTSAEWYPLLLGKLAESVVVISGAPNVGKSSLAVHLAKTLGLTRTKLRAKISGCLREARGLIFPFGYTARIHFGVKMNRRGLGCDNPYHLLPRTKNLLQEQSFSRDIEFLLFQGMQIWPPLLFTLAATGKLLFERGTEARSIRKHKLFLSNVLEQLQKLNKMIILEGEKSQVYLVCQALQITLLEDAALDASHLSADIELDGRWTF